MTTQVAEKPVSRVVERAKRTVASRTVFIMSNTTGIVPMERRLADGTKNVSRCDYGPSGNPINRVNVRPLDFGTTGIMALNPLEADDMALLDEFKLWIADGSDSRIRKFNITMQEGGSVEAPPIALYEKRKPTNLIAAMTEHLDLISDDPEACRVFLEQCARYEMQREGDKPARPKILNAIDELGYASGVEYGTDDVVEDDE